MSQLVNQLRDGARPIIGMVQLRALPGSSRYQGANLAGLIAGALDEARSLTAVGVDALMVQNLGDLPVDHHATLAQVAWMTRIASAVREESKLPTGLNLLENDVEAMLAAASGAGLDFVRIKAFVGAMITPGGVVQGAACRAQRARSELRAEKQIAILADVHDRTGIPLGGRAIDEDIREAVDLGGADAIVLTGGSFEESISLLKIGRRKAPGTPLVIGGSASSSNIQRVFEVADGAIVSSSLKPSGTAFGQVDPVRAKEFMEAVRVARREVVGSPLR